MRIIKPSIEINYPTSQSDPIRWIESCARICYKSENKITENSGKKMITNLINSKHLSVLEHFRFIIQVPSTYFSALRSSDPRLIKYFTMTQDSCVCIISANARALLEARFSPLASQSVKSILQNILTNIVIRYDCKELFPSVLNTDTSYNINVLSCDDLDSIPKHYTQHGWFTVKFVCDRGVSHEIVRHRVMSFSQESTRYCNYDKEKFGKQITVIEPCFWERKSEEYQLWEKTQRYIEEMYLHIIHAGATPQQARTVLTNSLKTEVAVTGTVNDWIHFLELRCSKAAHPQIRELALLLLRRLYEDGLTAFEPLYNKYKEEF